jgi:hypothetical protein
MPFLTSSRKQKSRGPAGAQRVAVRTSPALLAHGPILLRRSPNGVKLCHVRGDQGQLAAERLPGHQEIISADGPSVALNLGVKCAPAVYA